MKYGTTFPAELTAAGVGGLPFSWNSTGEFDFAESMTPEQREIVQAVADAHDPSKQRTPTPLEQIRALEAQYADAQAKLTRQSLLALALDKACADPLAAGLDRAQVHAFLLAGDNGYAALWNLEQEVEALRALA